MLLTQENLNIIVDVPKLFPVPSLADKLLKVDSFKASLDTSDALNPLLDVSDPYSGRV